MKLTFVCCWYGCNLPFLILSCSDRQLAEIFLQVLGYKCEAQNHIYLVINVGLGSFISTVSFLIGSVVVIWQVRGVRAMPLSEMSELFISLHIGVAPGLVRFWPFALSCLFTSDLFLSGVILVCTTSWGLQPTFDTYYVEQWALITSFWDLQDPNVNNIVAATTFYSGTAATLCLVCSIHQQTYSPLVELSSELVP